MRNLLMAFLMIGTALSPSYADSPDSSSLNIVAAENFYGDIAEQIGRPGTHVLSILTNPDEDPHLFEASPSTARALAQAQIVLLNGADYDPWMTKLLSASSIPGRVIIEVATLVGKKAGDNPHLWYDPATASRVAKALGDELSKLDPAHRDEYRTRVQEFDVSLRPLRDKIASLRRKYAGVPVTATEPVFGYMAEAIGLNMRNPGFQLAVMNDTEPSASEIAAFQHDLKTRAVKVLIYNSQTNEGITLKMRDLAKENGIPVIGVTETEPPKTHFQDWMLDQLNALETGLAGQKP